VVIVLGDAKRLQRHKFGDERRIELARALALYRDYAPLGGAGDKCV
jgi:hypothetical protein